MSDAKHTPGPWFAYETGVGGSHDRHGHWYGVGTYGDALGRGFDVALAEKHADALLIAAAPDLLRALENLVEMQRAGMLVRSERAADHDFVTQARDAISKARGK